MPQLLKIGEDACVSTQVLSYIIKYLSHSTALYPRHMMSDAWTQHEQQYFCCLTWCKRFLMLLQNTNKGGLTEEITAVILFSKFNKIFWDTVILKLSIMIPTIKQIGVT